MQRCKCDSIKYESKFKTLTIEIYATDWEHLKKEDLSRNI